MPAVGKIGSAGIAEALEWQRKPEAAAPGAVAELDEQRAPGPLGLGVDNAGRSAWRCHAG
jgi:hypothetical protein